jgi:hypothetical protein
MNELESPETGKSVLMKEKALPDQRKMREFAQGITSSIGGGKVPEQFLIKRDGRAGT